MTLAAGAVAQQTATIESDTVRASVATNAGIYCNVISRPLRGASADGSSGIWCGDFRYSFKEEN